MIDPLVMAAENRRLISPNPSDRGHVCHNCQKCFQEQIVAGRVDRFTPECNLSSDIQVHEVLKDDTSSSELEQVYLEYALDPVAWAKMEFGWEARWYQADMLRCTSRKKCARWGRRTGKSSCLAVSVLHKIYTNSDFKVLIITPYQDQVELIFAMITEMIDKSITLKGMVKRHAKSPSYIYEFDNNSQIRGSTAGTKTGAGASKIRGQEGHFLCLDEMDMLSKADIESVLAIYGGNKDSQLWASGTPTGKREYYYKWATDPAEQFMALHVPSSESPNWTKENEDWLRNTYSESGYLAEFCLSGATKVKRVDGSVVQIKDLRVGDTLVSNTGEADPCSVVDHRLTGRQQQVIGLQTDFGGVVATPDHNFKTLISNEICKEEARDLQNLILSPSAGVYPTDKDSTLARLIGYINGDGTVANHSAPKPRMRGPMPGSYKATFYGCKKDVENIAEDMKRIFNVTANPYLKCEGKESETYAIDYCGAPAKELVLLGAVVGKKTQQYWTVPDWIRNHQSLSVKLEFIGGLWGAEGTTPKVEKNGRSLHSMALSMCKRDETIISDLFRWMQETLEEAGIAAAVTTRVIKQKTFVNSLGYKGKTNCKITEALTVCSSIRKNSHFYDFLPVRYCVDKEKTFFLFARYIDFLLGRKALEDQRAERILQLRSKQKTIREICLETGASNSQVQGVIYKRRKGYLSHSTPPIHSLEVLENGSVVAPVREKIELPCEDVYNITVDSPDHSYLLNGGINTYNCAGFPELEMGVFPARLVDETLQNYDLLSMKKTEGWIYGVGADWNSASNGVHIVLEGYNPADKKFWMVKKWTISRENYTQIAAIEKIIEINNYWEPSFIYVDAGYGHSQVDILHEIGRNDPGAGLHRKLKAIDMGGKVEVLNPVLGRVKKHTKPYMVNLCVRRLEHGEIVLPKEEYRREGSEGLIDQMLAFHVKRVSTDGRPVYSQGAEHTLTAWMLSVYGFWMELTDLSGKGKLNTKIGVIQGGGEEPNPDYSPLGKVTFKAVGDSSRGKEESAPDKERLLPISRGFDLDGPRKPGMASIRTLQMNKGSRKPLGKGIGRTIPSHKPHRRKSF